MADTVHRTASSPVAVPVPSAPVRIGAWTSYRCLLRWTLAQIGAMLPLIVVVQALLAAGIIIGFGFLIPDLDRSTAAFLSTGAPTVLLMVMGLVMVPQGVAQARTNGTFTYLRALPVPRPLLLFAELTVWLAIALPSIAVAVVVSQLRYDLAYSFDWLVLLGASLLIAAVATSVGYALAVSLPPLLAQLVSQVLVFFVLLFSPVTFPAAQLPAWFQRVHDLLPIRPAADLLRSGLLSSTFEASWSDLGVLLAWCAFGLAISVRALVRRD